MAAVKCKNLRGHACSAHYENGIAAARLCPSLVLTVDLWVQRAFTLHPLGSEVGESGFIAAGSPPIYR